MSADSSPLLIERRGPVMWLTLNRPERLNAINSAMADHFADLLISLKGDTSVRVIVLRGAGRGFSAGLDLHDFEGLNSRAGSRRLPEIVLALHEAPQVVVALVHGVAIGGGFAFALAADIRIAGDSARFSAGFVNVGLTGCELGTSYFLPRYVGTAVTADLLLTGRSIDAARAMQLGLVSDVVPDDSLMEAGEELVQRMVRLSPMGLRKGKETIRLSAAVNDLETAMTIEMQAQAQCAKGPHFDEAIAAFREKRDPVFVDPRQ